MDLLEQFKTILNKKYLAHIHTIYTEGSHSVEDYCKWAFDQACDAVVFSEHVRKTITYDFDSFLHDLDNARFQFPSLNIWTGVESKILPGGILDIPDEIVPKTQVIYFACHSFPDDIDLYKDSFTKLFQDKKWKKHVRIWAHPGKFFKQRGISIYTKEAFKQLCKTACCEDVLIENNIRDSLPPLDILKTLSPSEVIIGYDAHSLESLEMNCRNESL